jgi:hypothetical protein
LITVVVAPDAGSTSSPSTKFWSVAEAVVDMERRYHRLRPLDRDVAKFSAALTLG